MSGKVKPWAHVAEGVIVAQQSRALTELVRKVAGPDAPMTQRELAERSVDPATGYSPSKSLIGKIVLDQSFKVTPALISALAVGLGVDRATVAAAAYEQYIGYEVVDAAPGAGEDQIRERVATKGGAVGPKAKAWLERQASEE